MRHSARSQSDRQDFELGSHMPGHFGTVLPVVFPPDNEIHRLQNQWDQVAVGIHIYGKDMTRCRSFDLTTNRWTWRELHYTDA